MWQRFVIFLLLALLSRALVAPQAPVELSNEELLSHVDAGDLQALSAVLDASPSLVNYQNEGGHTLLHRAASLGHLEVVQYLITNLGADLVLPNMVINGFHALHWSCSNGHEQVVKLLLDSGAPIEARDFNGRTPLMIACERGHRAIALLLIENGASIEAESDDLKAPLHYAAFSGLLPVVQLLVNRGLDVNARTKWKDTPLHYACSGTSMGHVKIIHLLLERGAEVDALGMQGDTPFHWACWKGLGAIAELLVRHGADMLWAGYGHLEQHDATPFSLGACEVEPLRSKLAAAYDKAAELRQGLRALAQEGEKSCAAGSGKCRSADGEEAHQGDDAGTSRDEL